MIVGKKQISKNVILSILEVLFSSIIIFLLYRYIIDTLGVSKLGIWSLVLATTSITRISEFGLSGSVVKFVAKYLALDQLEDAGKVIQTSFITIAVFLCIFLTLFYGPIIWFLKFIVPPEGLFDARLLVPYALISLWSTTLAGVVQSGLDGCQRIDLRRTIMIFGNIFYYLIALMLIKRYGLLGLAYSQIAQQFVVLFISWIVLLKVLPVLSIFPHTWSRSIFLEILKYGANFQLIALLAIFIDPLTKALFSRFGGLHSVGYYEMANKLIEKLRALLINANQVLIPVYATLQEKNTKDLADVYKMNSRVVMYVSVILYMLIVAMGSFISTIWIGHYVPFFVLSLILMSCVAFVNTVNGPAYFAYMGIGKLYWNLIGHILMAILCVAFGVLGGWFFNENGVLVGRFLSGTIGGLVVILAFHKESQISASAFFTKEDLELAIVCFLGVVADVYLIKHFGSSIVSYIVGLMVYLAIIIYPAWRHPTRVQLISWALNRRTANYNV